MAAILFWRVMANIVIERCCIVDQNRHYTVNHIDAVLITERYLRHKNAQKDAQNRLQQEVRKIAAATFLFGMSLPSFAWAIQAGSGYVWGTCFSVLSVGLLELPARLKWVQWREGKRAEDVALKIKQMFAEHRGYFAPSEEPIRREFDDVIFIERRPLRVDTAMPLLGAEDSSV
jgi:hypothetical protein